MSTKSKVSKRAGARWNPRFVAYARSNQLTPRAQLAADARLYPGGKMAGFILWNMHQWRKWKEETGFVHAKGWTDSPSQDDHDAYTAWLAKRFP